MKRFIIDIASEGNTDIINLNPQLTAKLKGVDGDGVVHLFIAGSNAALKTNEFETGLIKHDMPRIFQHLVPDDDKYDHEATWNDDNGHSHVRAALVGPSLTVPFSNGKLLTGEYQQVVLVDFDTRPRKRKIICTVIV